MRESTYKAIDAALQGYDIVALYEVGFPLGFSNRLGLNRNQFEEYYEEKKKRDEHPEQVTGQSTNQNGQSEAQNTEHSTESSGSTLSAMINEYVLQHPNFRIQPNYYTWDVMPSDSILYSTATNSATTGSTLTTVTLT